MSTIQAWRSEDTGNCYALDRDFPHIVFLFMKGGSNEQANPAKR